MIQNARDAIRARMIFEPDLKGNITVTISSYDDSVWLTIDDNGVGMSERILTGPLLDFGTSFWTSALVKSEFPGLRSSRFKAVGRFGIGFYSVFMVADEVYVSSRPWQHGIVDVKQIQFSSGLTLRPLLKNKTPSGFSSTTSTQIKLRLKNGIVNKDLNMQIFRNLVGSENLNVPMAEYLSAICAGLDIPVYFTDGTTTPILVHQNIYDKDFDSSRWLKEISFSNYQESEVSSYIDNNFSRLRVIEEDGEILGRAAISTLTRETQNFLNILTIGGLAGNVHQRGGGMFIGFIETSPNSAKRDTSQNYIASKETLKE